MPQDQSNAGKRPRARVDGGTRAHNDISHTSPLAADEGQRVEEGVQLRPTETFMVVGWSYAGNFCHIPIIVAGVACTALVDTGSNATLVRPDLVPVGTALEPTSARLKTVTGDFAPIKGKGLFRVCPSRSRRGWLKCRTPAFWGWIS